MQIKIVDTKLYFDEVISHMHFSFSITSEKKLVIKAWFAQSMNTCVIGFICIWAQMDCVVFTHFITFTEDCATCFALSWCKLMCIVVLLFEIRRHVP